MTLTAKDAFAFERAANWLAQCEVCGVEHEPIPQGHGYAPTMASPKDGHYYRARWRNLGESGQYIPMSPVDLLRRAAREGDDHG